MRKLLILLAALLPLTSMASTEITRVEFDENSVIFNVDLYDITDPTVCPAADVTHDTEDLNITVFDDVTNGEVDFFECTGAACVTTDTIEDITTLGTYATPTAANVRFKVNKAGSCQYQVQFADTIYSVTNSNRLDIEISAPGIMTANVWIDLTAVRVSTLVAAIWDALCSAHTTSDTMGDQACAKLNAVLADTGTTLENRQVVILDKISAQILVDAAADSGSTTTIVDTDGLDQADDFFNDWAAVVVEGNPARCIRDQDNATNTITFAPALQSAVSTDNYVIIADPSCNGTAARDSVMQYAMENGSTFEELTCYMASILAGESAFTSGSPDQAIFSDPSGTDVRVTVNYGTDAGDRTSVTLSATNCGSN